MHSRQFLAVFVLILVAALGFYGYWSIEEYGLQSLVSLVSVYGVAAIIFAESGLLIGFFLPGDSLLFTVGFLIQQEIVQFNIHLTALLFFAAATLGDNVGYTFGRRVGRKLFDHGNAGIFRPKHLKIAERFYEKHGGKTIILARFVPVVRTLAPIIAGTSHMSYRRFLAFNIIGALIWAIGITYLGYYAGTWVERYNLKIEYILVAVIVITFVPPFYQVLKDKQQRIAIRHSVTRQFSRITHKQK